MQLLLLDIPWCAAYYDERGVTAGIRGQYYSMLQSLADEYHVPVVTFQDHEYDPKFLNDHRSHLNPEGWAFIDRDIDAFWHGKLLPCR
jgi:poly-D-alanine transfer protein DltD